jgi:hypothetical protein
VGGALRRLFDARRGVVGAEGIGEHVVQDVSYAETSPSAVVVGAEILDVFQALAVLMISMDGCLHLSCMLCEYNTSKGRKAGVTLEGVGIAFLMRGKRTTKS